MLGVVEKFVYLGSYMSVGSDVLDEANVRIIKAISVDAKLDHL